MTRLGDSKTDGSSVVAQLARVVAGVGLLLVLRVVLRGVLELLDGLAKALREPRELRAAEALLARFGFRPFSYDPRTRFLRPLTATREGRDDTIYVRDPEGLSRRLAASKQATASSGESAGRSTMNAP